jgi:hypothetical protein
MRHRSFLLAAGIALGAAASAMAAPTPAPPAARASTVPAVPALTPTLAKDQTRLRAALRSDVRPKVDAVARALLFDAATQQHQERVNHGKKESWAPLDAARSRIAGAGYFGVASPTDADIEAIAYIVLLQAARDQESDLKDMVSAMKAINKAKEALRQGKEGLAKAIASEKPTNADAERIRLAAEKDALAELGDEETLRLQTAMDRMSRFMQALSNLEKKAAETSAAIVQNMK